jgi:hypothetical protein
MNFIYLIQGSISELERSIKLLPAGAKAMLLTYEDTENANIEKFELIKYLDSTWAEGRNFLLERVVLQNEDYDYVVFMDGDVAFSEGSFIEFESLISQYKPKLGIPLSDQILKSHRFNPKAKAQKQFMFDQIVQAYSRDVVENRISIPYDPTYDAESWWYACEINQYLSYREIKDQIIQFNSIKIINTHHELQEDQQDSVSLYRGGTTASGINEIKNYIEMKYGSQPKTIGTLFHPWYLPKLRFQSSESCSVGSDRKSTRLMLLRVAANYQYKVYMILSKVVPSLEMPLFDVRHNSLSR